MSQPSMRTRLTGIATVLVAVVLLRMTRDVTMPIVAGLLIAAIVWPIRQWCARFMPRPLALLATVLFVVAVTVALLGLVAWSGARVGERIVERRERLELLHAQANAAAARVGLQLPDLPGSRAGDAPGAAAGGEAGREARADAATGSTARRIGMSLFSALGLLGLTLGFTALALAEVRSVRQRIELRFQPERAARALAITGEVAHTMRRYVAVKSLTSGITGMATLLLALAFGLDFAPVWGLVTFLFEFVPTVGSVLAVIPPALYALVQFGDITRALALTASLTVMQLFLGNYVDPRIEGRLLSLSPFVVLASIVLWAWIWGAPGALLGVPLTVGITTAARHFASSHWLWALLTVPNGEERASGEMRANGDERVNAGS